MSMKIEDVREQEEVMRTIYELLNIFKDKRFDKLSEIYSDDLTVFGNIPPLHLMDKEEVIWYKRSLFSDIVDLSFEVSELSVSLHGNIALATFYLRYKGVAVYRYSFEGKPVKSDIRCTMVLKKEGGKWRIFHEHLSSIQY